MTMPDERTRVLRWAGEFLRQLSDVQLPEDLKRQLPYVLRHFPSAVDIANEARRQAAYGDRPYTSQWLAPEDT